MKTALLIMVHGSPTAGANDPMFAVAERARARAAYDPVEVGFMECNEPSIPDAIARCVVQGASAVIAVPYFLHLGTHVADDLPTLLDEARARHPGVEFRMGQYLGRSPIVTEVMAARAETAVSSKQ